MNNLTKASLISAYVALQAVSSVSAQDSANEQKSPSENPPVSKSKSNEVIHLKDGSGVVVDGVLYLTAPHQVLAEKAWAERMTPDDYRGLSPLVLAHINPYGVFSLDMDKRLALKAA